MRRRFLTVFAVAGIISSLTFVGSSAVAVVAGSPLQLDGNPNSPASPPTASLPDDWDKICHDSDVGRTLAGPPDCFKSGSTLSGAEATAWGYDGSTGTSPEDGSDFSASIFAGGSSKDPIGIEEWTWKDGGGLPDKDNLLHAFAAKYRANQLSGSTGTYLYFGSDRYDNSGDAMQGFWFLQNRVVPTPDGRFARADGVPGEIHTTGDVLVISDFSIGGSTAKMSVFSWDKSCLRASALCEDQNLRKLTQSGSNPRGEWCGNAGAPDRYCGIVNTTGDAPAVPPWPFKDKKGNTSVYGPNEFFEGVINLTALDPKLASQCFGSFVSETRSSTSVSATLKDFILDTFEACDTDFSTTASLANGDEVVEPITLGASGSVDVKDRADLKISGATVWSGTIDYYLCGPTVSVLVVCDATQGRFVSSRTVSDGTTSERLATAPARSFYSDATTVTSAGYYCWFGRFTSATFGVPGATDGSDTECFQVNPARPTITTVATTPVLLGHPIVDVATLAGTAKQPDGDDATGGITFRVFGPVATDSPTCITSGVGANLAYTSPVIPVDGDDDYSSGSGFTPLAPGFYYWIASYSGDGPNTDATSGSCGVGPETSEVVQVTPGLATAQSFYPQDSATITVSGFPGLGNITGTVLFRLYVGSKTCYAGNPSRVPDWTTGESVDVAGTKAEVTTTNDKVSVSDGTTMLSWWVAFDSDNPGIADIPGQCREYTEYSISDGTSYGP